MSPEFIQYKRHFSQINEREFEQEVINKVNWEQICNIKKGDPDLSCNNLKLLKNGLKRNEICSPMKFYSNEENVTNYLIKSQKIRIQMI